MLRIEQVPTGRYETVEWEEEVWEDVELSDVVVVDDEGTTETVTWTEQRPVIVSDDKGTTAVKTVTMTAQVPEYEPVPVLGRDLGAMITILGEAVKELHTRNEALEARIRALEPKPTPTPTPGGEVRE